MKNVFALLFILIGSYGYCEPTEFKGYLSISYKDLTGNDFFYGDKLTLKNQEKLIFPLLNIQDGKQVEHPARAIQLEVISNTDDNFEFIVTWLDISSKSHTKIFSREFTGVLNGQNDYEGLLSGPEKLSLHMNIDKVFTIEEIKKRFSGK